MMYVHPIALRKAKIVNNFGLSECNRVKEADSIGLCKLFLDNFASLLLVVGKKTDDVY